MLDHLPPILSLPVSLCLEPFVPLGRPGTRVAPIIVVSVHLLCPLAFACDDLEHCSNCEQLKVLPIRALPLIDALHYSIIVVAVNLFTTIIEYGHVH